MDRLSKRFRGFQWTVAGALAASTLLLSTPAQAPAATAGDRQPVLVAQTPRLAVRDLGRLAASSPVRITLALNYRNAAELEAFINAVSNPSSPLRGHFLTPAQFEARYAAAPADYRRVESALVAAGFTLHPTANHSIVDATAPAAAVERFFGTELHAVKQPSIKGVRYVNAAPAYLPAALRTVTFGVAGLNNLVVAKPQNVRGARRTDIALGPPLQGPDTGLGPFAFASAYALPVQFPKPGGGTYDGTGRSTGIAIDSDMLDSDFDGFLAYFKVKRTGGPLHRILVNGGPSPLINGDGVETNLDAETIGSLAPGAAVSLYLMPSLATSDIVDTYAQVVADDSIEVLNSSFGGCEIADNLSILSDHIAVQGAAEGITFAASSGDDGALTCIGYTPTFAGVSAPASAPHFTAVGGTSLLLNSAATYRAEYAWVGSGGGVSLLFGVPSYQVGIKNIIGNTRNVPDIAFDANPGTGAAFYYSGGFVGPIGGTSLSSPLFTAFLAEYNETVGYRAGFINSPMYTEFKRYGYAGRFRDITLGNNALFGPSYPGYNAGPGYDAVTGLGSLIGTPYAR